jgi:hypothetical protein
VDADGADAEDHVSHVEIMFDAPDIHRLQRCSIASPGQAYKLDR